MAPGFLSQLGPSGKQPTLTAAIRMATRPPTSSQRALHEGDAGCTAGPSLPAPLSRDAFSCGVTVLAPGEGYVGCADRSVKLVWRSRCDAAGAASGWRVNKVKVELLRCGAVNGGCLVARSIRDVGNLLWSFPRGGGGSGGCVWSTAGGEAQRGGKRGSVFGDGAWLQGIAEGVGEFDQRCLRQRTLRDTKTGDVLPFDEIAAFLEPEFTFRVTPLSVCAPGGAEYAAGPASASPGESARFFIAPPTPAPGSASGPSRPSKRCEIAVLFPGAGFRWRNDCAMTVRYKTTWTLDTTDVYLLPPGGAGVAPVLLDSKAPAVGCCKVLFPGGLPAGQGYRISVEAGGAKGVSAEFSVFDKSSKGLGEVVRPLKVQPPRRLAKIYAWASKGEEGGKGAGWETGQEQERTDGSMIAAMPAAFTASMMAKWNDPAPPRLEEMTPPGAARALMFACRPPGPFAFHTQLA